MPKYRFLHPSLEVGQMSSYMHETQTCYIEKMPCHQSQSISSPTLQNWRFEDQRCIIRKHSSLLWFATTSCLHIHLIVQLPYLLMQIFCVICMDWTSTLKKNPSQEVFQCFSTCGLTTIQLLFLLWLFSYQMIRGMLVLVITSSFRLLCIYYDSISQHRAKKPCFFLFYFLLIF